MCFECIWAAFIILFFVVLLAVALHKLTKAEDALARKEIENTQLEAQNLVLYTENRELQRKVNFYKNTSYGRENR